MHKIVHYACPESFNNMFKRAISSRTNNIVIEKCKIKTLSHFPSNVLPLKWNELSLDLKNESSIMKFKKCIFSSIIESYCQKEIGRMSKCTDCRR